MQSDRVKEIAAELTRLFEQQMRFLETKKLSEVTDEEIQQYRQRDERISELTMALHELGRGS